MGPFMGCLLTSFSSRVFHQIDTLLNEIVAYILSEVLRGSFTSELGKQRRQGRKTRKKRFNKAVKQNLCTCSLFFADFFAVIAWLTLSQGLFARAHAIWSGWPVTGTNFTLGSYFRPASEMRKGQRSWGRVQAQNSRNKANTGGKQKVITFAPYIRLATHIAVSLQINGVLMTWKIQQVNEDDSIRAAESGLKCS